MNAFLQISAGTGPEECCWVAARLAEELVREAALLGLAVAELARVDSEHLGNCRSVALAVHGPGADRFAVGWHGTVQWIGTSPFRPHHKRKNWFVTVTELETGAPRTLAHGTPVIETKRGSGAGGQNRNKRDTAVRVRLGDVVATAADERSQWRNKARALERLQQALRRRADDARGLAAGRNRSAHYALVRGNAARIYVGRGFKRKEAP